MCNACKVPNPKMIDPRYVRDIKRACREGQKKVPSWLAPVRGTAAELTHQLKRLAGNAKWEAHDCMENAVAIQTDGPLGHGWKCGICGTFLQAG